MAGITSARLRASSTRCLVGSYTVTDGKKLPVRGRRWHGDSETISQIVTVRRKHRQKTVPTNELFALRRSRSVMSLRLVPSSDDACGASATIWLIISSSHAVSRSALAASASVAVVSQFAATSCQGA